MKCLNSFVFQVFSKSIVIVEIFILFLVILAFNGCDFIKKYTQSSIQFTDVTKQAGVTFVHVGGSPEKRYIPEAKGGGCAFFDYNNDGLLDIFVVNGSTFEGFPPGKEPSDVLYRNNGDGTFMDVTVKAGLKEKAWGMGCVAADYDNNGWIDLYVTNFRFRNVLWHNNGNGTFTDITEKAGVGVRDDIHNWSTGAAFGDYDKDGYLDLYVSGYIDFDMNFKPVNMNSCQWRGMSVMYGPRGLKGAPDYLFHNNGDGTFTDVSEKAGIIDKDLAYGFAVVFTDYNNDGNIDIYVANDSTPNFLWRNNGDGTFTDVGLESGCAYSEDGQEQAGMGADAADYDNDGWIDLFVTNFADDYNTLYHSNRDGTFSDISFLAGVAEPSLPYVKWGTAFMDYDNDGWKDIFVAAGHVYPQVDRQNFGTSYKEPKLMFKNLRNDKFQDVSKALGPALQQKKLSRGTAFGDYDNDGDIDVLVFNLNDTPTLLRNDGGNRQNWLTMKLIGTKSSRDAAGARIKVITGKLSQIAETKNGYSFLCGNDLRVHFGLGKSKVADTVEIKWPSGIVQKFNNVKAKQFLTIREGGQPVAMKTR